jgi:hypothetical protein
MSRRNNLRGFQFHALFCLESLYVSKALGKSLAIACAICE